MLTYTGARNLFGQMSNNLATNNLSFGDVLINEGIRKMMGSTAWPFLEASTTISTVANQQFYNLPFDYGQLRDCTITLGTVVYRPIEVTSRKQWDEVNNVTGITSNIPNFFYIQNGQVGLWPTPSSAITNGLTVNYKKNVRDISVADYTTGSIVSVANGGTAVVGTGTSWTSQMAGRYIRITLSNTVDTGDGNWYQIASVGSTTTLTLSLPYNGTAISAGTAAYTIGDCMIIPENYQRGPVFYALTNFWMKETEDNGRSQRFMQMFEDAKDQMLIEFGNKTTDPTVSSGEDFDPINPNLVYWAT